jgi:hypothetical protein
MTRKERPLKTLVLIAGVVLCVITKAWIPLLIGIVCYFAHFVIPLPHMITRQKIGMYEIPDPDYKPSNTKIFLAGLAALLRVLAGIGLWLILVWPLFHLAVGYFTG